MATNAITAYTFRILDSDGSVFGKGCFMFEGPPGEVDIAHRLGGHEGSSGPRLTAFYYHDPIVGILSLKNLVTLDFSRREGGASRFAFKAWNAPENTHGITAGTALPGQLGAVSAHRGNGGDLSCQGRKLTFATIAEPRTVVEEGETKIPAVDRRHQDGPPGHRDGALLLRALRGAARGGGEQSATFA